MLTTFVLLKPDKRPSTSDLLSRPSIARWLQDGGSVKATTRYEALHSLLHYQSLTLILPLVIMSYSANSDGDVERKLLQREEELRARESRVRARERAVEAKEASVEAQFRKSVI